MERVTMSLDEKLLLELDDFVQRRGYSNRSEALRDLLRDRLEAERLASGGDGDCVACLSYVYDHHQRQLANRLVQTHHHHHDMGLGTLHIHIDHDNCFEITLIRGTVAKVRQFADRLVSQPGVRHGKLHMVPVETKIGTHDDGQEHDHGSGPHLHLSPRS